MPHLVHQQHGPGRRRGRDAASDHGTDERDGDVCEYLHRAPSAAAPTMSTSPVQCRQTTRAHLLATLCRTLQVEWCVLDVGDKATKEQFFGLTKTIHNNIHSDGQPLDEWRYDGSKADGQSMEDRLQPHRQLFEQIAKEATQAFFTDFLDRVGGFDPRRDIVIIHDPQPSAMIRPLKERAPGMTCIWRCHIGLDIENDATRAAWAFLKPYVSQYDHTVFSCPEYAPAWLQGRCSYVAPGIAPSAPKNKEMSPFEICQTLMRAGIMDSSCGGAKGCELAEDAFEHRAKIFIHPGSSAKGGTRQQSVITSPMQEARLPGLMGPARRRSRPRSGRPSPAQTAIRTADVQQAAVSRKSPAGSSTAGSSVQGSPLRRTRRSLSVPDLSAMPSRGGGGAGESQRARSRSRRLPRFSIPEPLFSPMVLTPHVQLATPHPTALCPSLVENSIPVLQRPVITQISRWDKLKGWMPLLQGFVLLKQDPEGWVRRLVVGGEPQEVCGGTGPALSQLVTASCAGCLSPEAATSYSADKHLHVLKNCLLLLAGPDPAFIADDPEGKQVLEELKAAYEALPPSIAEDVRIVLLPMENPVENALMVNALQRASFIVVQNSLREGFGLTATEAMYKRTPFVGTAQAVGLRTQVKHGVDGVLVAGDPSVPENVAAALNLILGDNLLREEVAVNGQRTAVEHFLVFAQLASWMSLVLSLMDARERAAAMSVGLTDEVANMDASTGSGMNPAAVSVGGKHTASASSARPHSAHVQVPPTQALGQETGEEDGTRGGGGGLTRHHNESLALGYDGAGEPSGFDE